MRRGLLRALIFLGILSWSAAAQADGLDYHEDVKVDSWPRWLMLPAELGSSAAWVSDRPGPVYRFATSVLPGVELFDWLGLQLVLGGLYRNPDYDGTLGGRASAVVARPAGGYLPLRLLAEAAWLPRAGALQTSAGASVGLGRLLSIAVLGSHDTDRDSFALGLRLGLELGAFGNPVAPLTHYVPYAPVPRRAE